MTHDTLAAFKPILYALADASAFLFTTRLGLACLGGFLLFILALRVASVLSERRLLTKAAGERMGAAASLGLMARELAASLARAAGALPALAAIAVLLALVGGLAESSRRLDEYIEGRQRLAELSVTLRNLERRYKVAELRVDSVAAGIIKARAFLYDASGSQAPARIQEFELPGSEIYVDAIVCNFDYSEIAAGRAVNLAIPYRVFSDELPQSRGIGLETFDGGGLPLVYLRKDQEIYGIEPGRFRSRLAELAAAFRDEGLARRQGIVRSLYGNAVHRRVCAGESFTVWVEQSGGITIKDASSF